jgi:hypothetical protein
MRGDRFRVRPGDHIDLHRYDPADTAPWNSKRKVVGRLE